MKTESKYREALKELILTKPLEEITVQVLCDKVNTPRQTFYYHFRDIYDVINSIILEEKIDRSNEIKIQSIIKNTITYTNKNFQFLYSLMNSYAKDLIIEFYYSHFYKKIGEIRTMLKDEVSGETYFDDDDALVHFTRINGAKRLDVYVNNSPVAITKTFDDRCIEMWSGKVCLNEIKIAPYGFAVLKKAEK